MAKKPSTYADILQEPYWEPPARKPNVEMTNTVRQRTKLPPYVGRGGDFDARKTPLPPGSPGNSTPSTARKPGLKN